MKLKLVAAISALAIPALAQAQQRGPPKVPKPTKADAQKVVEIITSDKVKTQAYCDLTKLLDQIQAVQQEEDGGTIPALNKQADALADKLGPEYLKVIGGLNQIDSHSSEGEEFMSILSGLDRSGSVPANATRHRRRDDDPPISNCTTTTTSSPSRDRSLERLPLQTAPAAWRCSPQSGTMPVGEAGGRPTPSRPCLVRRCCGTKVKVF